MYYIRLILYYLFVASWVLPTVALVWTPLDLIAYGKLSFDTKDFLVYIIKGKVVER